MKYPLSYVAAEHQKKKKKLLFSVSLASHALPLWDQKTTGWGLVLGSMAKTPKKDSSLKTRMFKTCEIRVCFRKSSKAPCKSYWLHRYTLVLHQNAGVVFRERSVIGGGSGVTSLSGKYTWKLYLKDEWKPFSWPILSPFSDKRWSNPGLLLPAGGQAGWGLWPSSIREAWIIPGLGGVPPLPPSPHTWLDHPVSGLQPTRQPVAIPSQKLVPGKGARLHRSRFTRPFPPGWKMKRQSATEHPYLEGHKMVRAAPLLFIKHCVSGRKLWRYERETPVQSASHQTVSAGSSGMS